jgi:hypothetical protein
MATTAQAWQIKGQYFESCSCDFLCPCPTSGLTARPTQGSCTFAMVFRIEQGQYGETSLDGLGFAVLGYTPEEMAKGNWSIGLVVDERAQAEQQQALATIASGQAGGPLTNLAPLIGEFRGVQTAPIEIRSEGMQWSVSIPGLLDQAVNGLPGANPAEPLYLDNTPHPANAKLGLAKAVRSHLHAFGLDWDDDSGRNNGHLAPFDWRGG